MDLVITVAIIIAAILFLVLFFTFVPLGLWISARASGVHIGIFQLVGMRIRKVAPRASSARSSRRPRRGSPFRSTSSRRITWPAATWTA